MNAKGHMVRLPSTRQSPELFLYLSESHSYKGEIG